MIDHVEQMPELEGFAYFHCKRDEEERSQPVSILRSLVRQLSSTFQRSEEIHQEVQTLATNMELQALTFSVGLCRRILSKLISSYRNTTIILDALDECNMDKRSHLMDCLSQLIDQQSNVKIFISSRKDADIIRHFESQPIIEIHATDNQHDIESFVKAELARDKRWDSLEPELEDKVISTLHRMSRGMFQWAALQVQHLTQLNFWSESIIEDRLGKLPRTLEKAYDEIWQMILLKDGIESRLGKRAISWVLCSPIPLTTEELSIAIKIDSDGCDRLFDFHETLVEKDIHSLCCNLLKLEKQVDKWQFNKEVDRWQFCHLSATEYIESRLIDQLQPYRKTALSCTKYLLAMCHREVNLVFPFDSFISWNWLGFVQQRENAQDALLCQLLFRFLGSPHVSSRAYRSWVRLLGFPHMRSRVYQSWVNESDFLLSVQSTFSSALRVICDSGMTWVLEEWRKNNYSVDVNSCDGHNQSLLSLAANRGHDELCRFLLRKGADIRRGSRNPLIEACANGHEATVRVLIEAGATINKVYSWDGGVSEGQTPIQVAISMGEHPAVVRLLLDHQADANLRNLAGATALDIAMLNGRKATIPLLLQHGARLGHSSLALVGAAQHNMTDWVEKCIDGGADVNGYFHEHSTALIFASFYGSLEAIEKLVELGAEVNLIQESTHLNGETALMSAAREGQLGSIKLLLSKGANPNIHGQEKSPLIEAIRYSSTPVHCLEALLDAGANVNFVSRTSGTTALVRAVQGSSPDKLRTLLRAGADPNLGTIIFSPFTSGSSPLATALGYGHYFDENAKDNIPRILLEAGADPNHNNGFSNCLCTVAAEHGYDERVWRRLIELGADPTLTFKEGPGSALATAALLCNIPFCRFLLSSEMGVDPNTRLHGFFDSALLAAIRGEELKDERLRIQSKWPISEASHEVHFSEDKVKDQFDEDFEDSLKQTLDNLSRDRLDEIFDRTGTRPLELYDEGSHENLDDRSDATEDTTEYYPEYNPEYTIEYGSNVIDILLRSGADIPMPIYRALGPGIPDLQLWGGREQLANTTLYTHIGGRTTTHFCIPQVWSRILWEVSSGPAPRLPFDREMRRCGLQSFLPSPCCIIMELSSTSGSSACTYVAIQLCRNRSDLFIYREDKHRFEPLRNGGLSYSVSRAGQVKMFPRGLVPFRRMPLQKFTSYQDVLRRAGP